MVNKNTRSVKIYGIASMCAAGNPYQRAGFADDRNRVGYVLELQVDDMPPVYTASQDDMDRV